MALNHDPIMNKWIQEAEKEFIEKGWQDASQNAVLMTVFSQICQRFDAKIGKIMMPLWTLAISIACAVVWLVVRTLIGV